MGFGVSLFLIALGAILTFAVTVSVRGIDLTAMGVILMAIGFAGLLFTMVILDSAPFGWRGYRGYRRREIHEVDDDVPTVRGI